MHVKKNEQKENIAKTGLVNSNVLFSTDKEFPM